MAWVAAAIGAAGVIGSAIMQWASSDAARTASAEERQKMRELLDAVQEPNFDQRQIQPEEFKVLQKFTPQVANYVEEKAPTLISADSENAKRGKEAQLGALSRYKGLSETGTDQFSNALTQEALRAAQLQNQGQQQSILQGMQRRGAGAGSGLELAAQLGAQQSAGNNAQDAALQASKNAYATKLDALRNYASLGGDVYNQDINLQDKNAGIINSFNARNASNQNQYNRYAADTQNQGNLYNVNQAQDVADRNERARYDDAVRQQQLNNTVAQNRFGNAMGKATGQMNVGQGFINDIRQNAQDRNNAYAGAASGITAAGQAYGTSNYNQNKLDAYNKRTDKMKDQNEYDEEEEN